MEEKNTAPGGAPGAQAQPENTALAQAQLEIANKFKNGANWFYWIAALSLVNSIVIASGGEWSFIVGLGITQAIDGVVRAAELGALGTVIGAGVNIIIIGVFIAFGVLSRKKYKWAFIAGMVLYALDGALFLLVGDWMSIAFHGLVLFWLYGGLKALNEMAE